MSGVRFHLLSCTMGWFLLLSATRREQGCMADGQSATQTAMNDVEALLGRITCRYGDEAVWQLSSPSSVSRWNMHCLHSSQLAHAAYIGRGSACHKAEGCCCRDGSWSLICISPVGYSLKAKPSGVHDTTQLPLSLMLADMITVIARLCGKGSDPRSCFVFTTLGSWPQLVRARMLRIACSQ